MTKQQFKRLKRITEVPVLVNGEQAKVAAIDDEDDSIEVVFNDGLSMWANYSNVELAEQTK